MKYIALLAVLLLMGWTWQMAQAEHEFGLNESREMENQIETIIREKIVADQPTVTNVTFQQLFTEVIEAGRQMQVHARYVIEDATQGGDSTRQTMEGLIRLKSEDGVSWQFAGQELKSPALEFKNGMRVDAKAAAEAPELEATATTPPTAAPAHVEPTPAKATAPAHGDH